MKLKKGQQYPMKKTNPNLNPFEVHINRSKHNVLGRKLKSDRGMPGISKHKAFKKRKDTLFQEYKLRHKTNHFIDQRIGERNSEMTEDDRIMARFTAERMRMFNKKTMFNLSDSEVLTHRGQTLTEIERFEDIRSDDDDDDTHRSGALRGKFVGDAHFGGGMLTKNKQDRESLIDELINESKKRKAERQKNKEETLEATEMLDEEWKMLGQITTSAGVGESVNEPDSKTIEDGYDVVMRQLKFEPHGQASQKLKTDEEIVKEDKDILERLEHERLKQLREIEAVKFGNHRSTDDIDDGFLNLTNDLRVDDEEIEYKSECSRSSDSKTKMNADNVGSEHSISSKGHQQDTHTNILVANCINSNESNEIDDADSYMETIHTHEVSSNFNCENDLNSDAESNDSSSDEECAMDDLNDLMPSVNQVKSKFDNQVSDTIITKQLLKSPHVVKESVEASNSSLPILIDLDLPYILDVPENYTSFKALLSNRSKEQQHLILERLLKNNHPTLDPTNKKKILKLAEYIMNFVNEEDFDLDALQNMVLHFTILKEFNKEECFKLLLDRFSINFDDFNHNDISKYPIKFLIWYIMLFLRPHGVDVLLHINRPALSILSKVVSETDINLQSQVNVSLLCCYLLLQDAKSSSTVYTDAIMFLQNLLINRLNNCKINDIFDKSKSQFASQGSSNSISINKNSSDGELKLHIIDGEDKDEKYGFKVMYLSMILLAGFVKTYRKYPQCKIMFKKVHSIVNTIDTESETYPLSVKNSIKDLNTLLEILQSASLPRLVKAAKKPKALRQYEPSFHIITEGKRSLHGLPAEKQEEQKLLHKYKNEMKGAMRELRKDRVFLANVKLGEKTRSDAERIKKVKEIFGAASAQQGELRSLKRRK